MDDRAPLLDAVAAVGLFDSDGLAEMATLVDAFFAQTLDADHTWIVDDDDGSIVGVAYLAPERMTSGTWNLYYIGVRPERQKQGRGAALLAWIELNLARRGERILLVETSGVGSFEATRAFYRRAHYEEEARIRDFYAAGDDKVIFRKALATIETAASSLDK